MPLALALALLAVTGGMLASYLYDDDAPIAARLAYGAATGFLALALIGFVGAMALGLPAGVGLAAVVVALPLPLLARASIRARLLADLGRLSRVPGIAGIAPWLYTIGIIALLWVVFSRVIIESDGVLSTGYVNNLGDLPLHLQIVASFAYGGNFPPEHPAYAGTAFAYPFLADFLTAAFVVTGASLREAFFLQNMVLGLALVGTLHRFTAVLTRDGLASLLAPLLVLFSGGLGFLMLIDEARAGEQGLVALLGALPHDYTIGEVPFRWGNAITTLLVTQRSLALGLPIALIVFVLLWASVRRPAPRIAAGWWTTRAGLLETARAERRLLVAGLLTGALPLVHAHSFGVVIGTAFLVGLAFRQWRERRWVGWAGYVVVALALALPTVRWSTTGSIADASSFIGVHVGWDRGELDVVSFWLLNTGLFIPLAIAAFAWAWTTRPEYRPVVLFSALFVVWFLVPNVIRLAPWVWDNIKVLFYGFIGAVPLVSLLLARLLRGATWPRLAGVAAVLALVLAGSLDVWRVASGQTDYVEFDADGTALAAAIKTETGPRAMVLHAPTYNSPVYLTGRRSLLGYTGYIWSHGLPYADREHDIRRIYAGEPDARSLLDRYEVDYVVVSPVERAYMPVDDELFSQFPVVERIGGYVLHEVPKS